MFMAAVTRVTCLLLFISLAYSWTIPSSNVTTFSIFDEMNRMMAAMHERFQSLMNASSLPSTDIDDRNELDAVEANCTTTTETSSKPNRSTQTTTCVKELILNGKKQMYEETNVTDQSGTLISQSKIYQTISLNTNNETLSTGTNNDTDVHSY